MIFKKKVRRTFGISEKKIHGGFAITAKLPAT